jgi:hypothetical protein
MVTKFILVLHLCILFASCNQSINHNTGSGHVTTENRTIQGEFKSIRSNAIDLIIEQSNKTEIIYS